MHTIDPRIVSDLRNALTLFHDELGPFIQSYGAIPADNSQARAEQATYANAVSVVNACTVGTQLVEFGADHLSAFVKIITEPMEIIAAWTCVRSMLESCSVSAWLLDPNIDSFTRAGRVFALRFEGMKSELKLMRATGVPQTQIEKLKARINEVEQDALADGFQPVTDKHGKRIGIGQPMPVATDMIEDMLGEGKMYCILSAVTHGHSYAIRGLNYVPVEQPGQGSYGDVPVKTFQKSVNIAGIALLGLCAARALARPLWNQCHYFGWNALRLEELLENVCDKIGDKPEHRFWRS